MMRRYVSYTRVKDGIFFLANLRTPLFETI
jgi:hypothetical protein